MSLLISILVTFLVVILVLYLINMLPIDGRAKQIARIIVIIIGVLSLFHFARSARAAEIHLSSGSAFSITSRKRRVIAGSSADDEIAITNGERRITEPEAAEPLARSSTAIVKMRCFSAAW